MTRARAVVFGYGPHAVALLETLEHLGVTPVAVVVPGNRTGPDVDLVAAHVQSKGWTLLVQPPRSQIAPWLETLRQLRPDLFVIWSYSMLLPPELIALARLGAVNVHGGLLPDYRGGHVMNWAIVNGEPETGVTLAYLDEGIDTGPVIAARRFPIERDDDAASVRDKLQAAGEALIEAWWPALEAGTAPAVAQDESRARYYRMRTANDGRIDWSASNTAVDNLVRALVAPWPGAFCFIGRTKIVVRRSQPLDADTRGTAPGTVTRCDADEVYVSTGSGLLQLLSVEIDGRPVGGEDLRQAGVVAGARLAGVP